MLRRDLLSRIAAVGAAPAVLPAVLGVTTGLGITTGATRAVAGNDNGLTLQGCSGTAGPPDKSSNTSPKFKCDFVVEKIDTCQSKCVVTINNCVIWVKKGKGRGRGEWKTVQCPTQTVTCDCNFKCNSDGTMIIIVLIFSCKDVTGNIWNCCSDQIDCSEASSTQCMKDLCKQKQTHQSCGFIVCEKIVIIVSSCTVCGPPA